MILKSFGCSFIFGSDFPDTSSDNFRIGYSHKTWPALYAKELDYSYQCYARPGAGNLQITEKVLEQTINSEFALYVIAWSWIDRFDYTKNIRDNCQLSRRDNWQTIMPNDQTDLAKMYYRDIHSEYRDKLTTLINMKLVIDTLKQKNLPFIMTYMDELIFDQRWHTTPAILSLQDYVCPYLTTFDGMSFLEWSRSNGYSESKTWHPLEEAHAAAAEYILQLGVHKV